MHPYYYLVLLFLIGSILILWAAGGGHGGHIYQRGNWFLSIDLPVIRLQRENIQNRPYFNHRQLFKRWFRLGTFVSLVIVVSSLVLLVNNLWTVVNRRVLLIWGSGGSGAGQTPASTQPVLQVVLPGYNLPLSGRCAHCRKNRHLSVFLPPCCGQIVKEIADVKLIGKIQLELGSIF